MLFAFRFRSFTCPRGCCTPAKCTMASSLLAIFETYQKARVQFVQAVAEAATRPQAIDTLTNAGAMQLLRPLLLDNVSEF